MNHNMLPLWSKDVALSVKARFYFLHFEANAKTEPKLEITQRTAKKEIKLPLMNDSTLMEFYIKASFVTLNIQHMACPCSQRSGCCLRDILSEIYKCFQVLISCFIFIFNTLLVYPA